MPRLNLTPAQRKSLDLLYRAEAARLGFRGRPNKKRRRDTGDGVPVKPDRPNTLTGGAAVPLEFDD